MRKYILLGLYFFMHSFLYGQQTKTHSDHAYLYKIDKADLKLYNYKYLKKNIPLLTNSVPFDTIDYNNLHSFRTTFKKTGTFLLVYIDRTSVKFELIANFPWKVQAVFYPVDGGILITDSNNNSNSQLDLHFDSEKLHYDSYNETYVYTRIDQNGTLTISDGTFTQQIKLNTYATSHSNWGNNNYNSPDYTGFVATNKPVYKHGDTLKIKVYMCKEYGKPYTKNIFLKIANQRRAELKPISPGAYVYEYVITDSLKLDQTYSIDVFTKNWGYTTLRNTFKVEDYKLDEIEYNFKPLHTNVYKNDSIYFIYEAFDKNHNTAFDAEIDIVAIPYYVPRIYSSSVYFPDTLYQGSFKMQDLQNGVLQLPNFLQSKYQADYMLRVIATCKNSNNELKKIETSININYGPRPFQTYISNYHIKFIKEDDLPDSIRIVKQYDYNTRPVEWKIHKNDSVKLDPLASGYIIDWGGQLKTITVDQSMFNVYITGRMSADSLYFDLHNPAGIPVYTYYIKNELKESLPDIPHHSMRLKKNEQVNIYYEYKIGASKIISCRSFMIDDKNIFLKTDLPDKVYPGQSATMNISSFNYKKQALVNTNLTVLSINSAFQQNNVPQVPLFGKQISTANTSPKGYLTDIELASYIGTVDSSWVSKFGLQNNLYYKTIVSKSKVSVYREAATYKDAGIVKIFALWGRTLFTEPIYVEENGQMVYYNQSETDHIKTTQGIHQYKVRFNNFSYDLPPVMVYNDSVSYVVLRPVYLNKKTDKKKIPEDSRPEQLKIRDQFMILNKNEYSSYPTFISNYKESYCIRSLGYGDLFLGPFSGNDSAYVEQFYGNKTNFIALGISKTKRNFLYKHTVEDKGFENYNIPMKEKFNDNPFLFKTDLSYYYQTYDHWANSQFDLLYNDFNCSKHTKYYSYKHSSNKVELICKEPNFIPAGTILMNLSTDSTYKYKGYIQNFYDLVPGSYRIVYIDKNLQPLLQDSFYMVSRGTLIKSIDSTAFFKTKVNNNKGGLGFTIKGQILDKENLEPIPFATITLEKNGKTLEGTFTDIDGQFSLNVPNEDDINIKFMSIGYTPVIYSYDMIKSKGPYLVIQLDGSTIELNEFVMTRNSMVEVMEIRTYSTLGVTNTYSAYTTVNNGYMNNKDKREEVVFIDGGEIRRVPVTMGEADIVGALLVTPGVVTSDQTGKITDFDGDYNFSHDLNPDIIFGANHIRSFFADNAIWQPNLITNENGNVSCQVKFPENITSWRTYILAMNEDGLSGQMVLETKSFKPVVASLYIPDFVVEGDSFEIVNKVMNYTSVEIDTKNKLQVGNVDLFQVDSSFRDFYIQKRILSANASDSITISFSTSLNNGYLDGEKRVIPVYPKGINVYEGKMFPAWKNTVISIDSLDSEKEVELEVYNGFEELVLKETDYLLFHYRHACNEQISSKLIVAICASAITKKNWKKDMYDLQIENMIRLLRKNQNDRGGWSWWGNGRTNVFMTLKVGEALKLAEEKGYTVELKHTITNTIPFLLEDAGNRDDTLAILKLAGLYKIPKENVFDVKSIYTLSIPKTDYQKLLAMEIRQLYQLPFDASELMDMKHETLFGNYYWGNNSYALYDNASYMTSMALDILQREKTGQDTLVKVIGYMMEKRINGHFFNTMTSAKMTMFFHDYVSHTTNTPPSIIIDKKDTLVINDVYQKIILPPNVSSIDIRTDKLIYVGYAQEKKLPFEAVKDDLFFIKTEWLQDEKPVTEITSGKFVTLHTRIIVKKDSKYMSVEIPIPAGCTYAEKKNNSWYGYEVHREYFKDRIAIYYENLPVGTYDLYFKLEPRFKGTYAINNSLIENMYFPQLNGYNALQLMKIK